MVERKQLDLVLLKFIYILILLFSFTFAFSQENFVTREKLSRELSHPSIEGSFAKTFAPPIPDSSFPNKKRIWLVTGAQAGLWVGSFIALNQLWYADYPRTSFHFFNDNREWNQMDKLGHVFSTFQISNISSKMWMWAGVSHKKSVLYGAIAGIAYQSIIEIQDGYSAEWGFSTADMGSNFLGAAMFVAQELTWEEKRIRLKLSFTNHNYPKDVTNRYEQLFGTSFVERYLKDYNSQTYWMSVNPRSFFKNSKFPKWLNIATGYSSDLLLGGRENRWTDKQGVFFDRTDIPRTRRFYLSPDVDFTRIPTKSKFLKTIFLLMGGIKIPAPTLELNSKGNLRGHWFYF